MWPVLKLQKNAAILCYSKRSKMLLYIQYLILVQSLQTSQIQNHMHAMHTHTLLHPFNGHLSGTTQVSRYQKGKTSLDLLE